MGAETAIIPRPRAAWMMKASTARAARDTEKTGAGAAFCETADFTPGLYLLRLLRGGQRRNDQRVQSADHSPVAGEAAETVSLAGDLTVVSAGRTLLSCFSTLARSRSCSRR